MIDFYIFLQIAGGVLFSLSMFTLVAFIVIKVRLGAELGCVSLTWQFVGVVVFLVGTIGRLFS